ncbi:MAG: hypothetical protein ACJAYF_003106 [Arenicella sp.]|jgi:hypothetical protein
MNKRNFIKIISLSLFPDILNSNTSRSISSATDVAFDDALEFISLSPPPSFLINIGQCYLYRRPWENHRGLLAALLLNDDSLSEQGASSEINAKIEMDFADSDMVEIDGWLLSLTEARQYALLSLSDSQG